MIQPVLILHGGAGTAFKDQKRRGRLRRKISSILKRSYEKLRESSALDTVTYTVRLFEDESEFNAGTGSQLQADGKARLTASVMDGRRERFAAVINLERIKNPILVARALLEEESRVLAGRGACQFAKKLGVRPSDPRTRESILRWHKKKEAGYDTVGALALDRWGNLASATSTGGRGFEFPGRVSDSGMPVANYADERCAISVTGIGEEIIEEGLAIKIATRVCDGLTLRRAFRKTFREVLARGRRMGAVGLDAQGHIAFAHTTEILMYGWRKGRKVTLF